MSKKVNQRKAEIEYERKKAEEETFLNSLTAEERDAYNKQQEERRKKNNTSFCYGNGCFCLYR